MCIGCLAEEECIGEIIPGWYLGRAHKDYKDENLDWKIGTFGVIRCNDPDFIIPLTNIQEDPFFGWSDNDIDMCEDQTLNDLDYLFCKQLSSFQIRLNPMIGYNLIKTAMDAGFDPNASGFEAWFLHKCAVVLKNYKPEV